MNHQKSIQLFNQAKQLFPGGVNSPARAFRAVGGNPIFFEKGEGAYLIDVDNNRYIDYVLSWGALIAGHAHESVVQAIYLAAQKGSSFGAPHALEIELAEKIRSFLPNLKKLRFVNSGTEATMSALRLARAFTKRDKIIKFEGCYHGHADMLLVKAGSGAATLGIPDSAGVPLGTAQDTLTAEYNSLSSVQQLFKAYPQQIGAVIVEPVVGNMGVIPPQDGFLHGLRQITHNEGALLIFDEVMTGFRVHPSCAQGLYNVEPDLTTLGKVIGGGLPVGAYGGSEEIMDEVAPLGAVYQAGTLSGNPIAMSAGLATLRLIEKEEVWLKIEKRRKQLVEGLQQAGKKAGISLQVSSVGSMFTLFFSEEKPLNWQNVQQVDKEKYALFFKKMVEQGIYLAPSPYEANFLSIMHDEEIIQKTINAAEQALKELTKNL